MMNPAMIPWLLSLMTAAAPPDRINTTWAGHVETVDQRTARYQEIAEAAAEVAMRQPLYRGPRGHARTAATLLAVAFHESGFQHDVDIGPCYRGQDGKGPRCDGGKAACMMQIEVGDGATREGWKRDDLFGSRTKCFEAGRRILASSMVACKRNPRAERWALYAGGMCERTASRAGSRELDALIERWLGRVAIPLDEAPELLPSPGSPPELAGR